MLKTGKVALHCIYAAASNLVLEAGVLGYVHHVSTKQGLNELANQVFCHSVVATNRRALSTSLWPTLFAFPRFATHQRALIPANTSIS